MVSEIRVDIKEAYGRMLVYPVCEQGKLICKLLNTKTFTEGDRETLKKIGFTFKVINKDI